MMSEIRIEPDTMRVNLTPLVAYGSDGVCMTDIVVCYAFCLGKQRCGVWNARVPSASSASKRYRIIEAPGLWRRNHWLAAR